MNILTRQRGPCGCEGLVECEMLLSPSPSFHKRTTETRHHSTTTTQDTFTITHSLTRHVRVQLVTPCKRSDQRDEIVSSPLLHRSHESRPGDHGGGRSRSRCVACPLRRSGPAGTAAASSIRCCRHPGGLTTTSRQGQNVNFVWGSGGVVTENIFTRRPRRRVLGPDPV